MPYSSTPVSVPVQYNNFTVASMANGVNPELQRNLEAGIMNLHSNLKELEGKYIDLANFYKQELISQNTQSVHIQPASATERPISTFINNKNKQIAGKRTVGGSKDPRDKGRGEVGRKTPRQDGKQLRSGVLSNEYEERSSRKLD